jgi:hypothetical protein
MEYQQDSYSNFYGVLITPVQYLPVSYYLVLRWSIAAIVINKLMNSITALYKGLVIHNIYMLRSQEITVAKAAGVICTPRKMMIACTYRIVNCFMIRSFN